MGERAWESGNMNERSHYSNGFELVVLAWALGQLRYWGDPEMPFQKYFFNQISALLDINSTRKRSEKDMSGGFNKQHRCPLTEFSPDRLRICACHWFEMWRTTTSPWCVAPWFTLTLNWSHHSLPVCSQRHVYINHQWDGTFQIAIHLPDLVFIDGHSYCSFSSA